MAALGCILTYCQDLILLGSQDAVVLESLTRSHSDLSTNVVQTPENVQYFRHDALAVQVVFFSTTSIWVPQTMDLSQIPESRPQPTQRSVFALEFLPWICKHIRNIQTYHKYIRNIQRNQKGERGRTQEEQTPSSVDEVSKILGMRIFQQTT